MHILLATSARESSCSKAFWHHSHHRISSPEFSCFCALILGRHIHISRVRYAITQQHCKSFAWQIHCSLHLPHLHSLSGSLCRIEPLLESIIPRPSLIHLELDTVQNMSYRAWVDRVVRCVCSTKGTLTLHIGYCAIMSGRECSRIKQFRLPFLWPSLVHRRVALLSLVLINLCNEDVMVSSNHSRS